MYEARTYFDNKFAGFGGSFTSSDFDLIVDYSHDKLMQGYNVTIKNLNTGIEKAILSDMYCKEFDGEFIYSFEDFEEV